MVWLVKYLGTWAHYGKSSVVWRNVPISDWYIPNHIAKSSWAQNLVWTCSNRETRRSRRWIGFWWRWGPRAVLVDENGEPLTEIATPLLTHLRTGPRTILLNAICGRAAVEVNWKSWWKKLYELRGYHSFIKAICGVLVRISFAAKCSATTTLLSPPHTLVAPPSCHFKMIKLD